MMRMMIKQKREDVDSGKLGVVVPERFQQAVNEHLVGNLLDLPDYPVILSIFGEPGMGKTFQLRRLLEMRGFHIHSINAADMESDRAGEPTKLLRKEYVNASAEIVEGEGAAIIIDDIDTTLGEWETYTGTVNHQDLIAFFMHIADSPTSMENIGTRLKRVPIFFTGNNFSKLYTPLRRPGRMNLFEYVPTLEEKTEVVTGMFGSKYRSVIFDYLNAHPELPIAFFSSVKANAMAKKYEELVKSVDFSRIIKDKAYQENLVNSYNATVNLVAWEDCF